MHRREDGREGEKEGWMEGKTEGRREERIASVGEKNQYSNETSLHNTRQFFLCQKNKQETEVYGTYDNS